MAILFQFTHSVRSATNDIEAARAKELFQFTHSVRSATDAYRTGHIRRRFQFTHSVRSATGEAFVLKNNTKVSIHALREECDNGNQRGTQRAKSFNSRTP